MTNDELSVLRDKSASRRSEWQRLTPDGKRECAMLNVEPLMGDNDLLVAECELDWKGYVFECGKMIPGDGFLAVKIQRLMRIVEAFREYDEVHGPDGTDGYDAVKAAVAALEGRNPTNDT